MTLPSLVVGTAGHIDHGKTSLVRTLTGIDLDRLPEERNRGITIALGATPLDLDDGRRVGLIDVPGHERLVRTMIAGATGIDAAILCVSAVDGTMPQTREHLAILELLGVQQGVIALTMADLVDEDLLELATDDVRDAVAGTFLEEASIVPFSAIDERGKDRLLTIIAGFVDPLRSQDGPFRMPVDRVFSRPGFGTVATGTVWSGQLEDGETVTLLPEATTARVRGIEVHGQKTNVAAAGRRTALNLAGLNSEDVSRGTTVVRGAVPSASMVDVRYTHLEGSPPLPDGSAVNVLLGTAERLARLYLAQVAPDEHAGAELQPGGVYWAQLRLEQPVPCLPGDRFIVRRPSPQVTMGGGEVLDPWAPRLRRRDRERAAQELARLASGESVVWLERAGEVGLTVQELSERTTESVGERLADRVFARRAVVRLKGALLEALAAYHHEYPLSLGAHRRELRRARLAHLPERVFDALVDQLATESSLHVEGALVRISGFEVELTEAQTRLQTKLTSEIRVAGLGGKSTKELVASHGDEVPAILRLLESAGEIREVANVGWLAPSHLDSMASQVRSWFQEHQELSPPDFKELTGLTRKAAIPLLEWLDGQRITQRSGNARVAGPALRA